MPTFHNPVRVDVIERGSGIPWELAAMAAAAAAVVLFILAHLVVIAAGLAVAAVLTAVTVWFLRRFMVLQWATAPLPERQAALTATVTAEAIAAPPQRPAIEAPALHIHFHGLAPEDAAAILRQAPAHAAALAAVPAPREGDLPC